MPTELEELKQIHAELSELAKGAIRPKAVIEMWPLLYKLRPANERPAPEIPGVITCTGCLLSDPVVVSGEFEVDGRPWLDAMGKPIVDSGGKPLRVIPGWKASIALVDETLSTPADALREKNKMIGLLTALGRFLPAGASPPRWGSGSVGPWLLYLAGRCVSGAAGKRHRTQWARFGWASGGNLIIMENKVEPASGDDPIAAMLKSLGDPAPQRIEIEDVIGASQVVLSEWIKEIETKGEVRPPIVASTAGATKRRFAVAFTFPGEKRKYVEAVDRALRKFLNTEMIFYDGRYEHELARLNLDTYLQKIYHDEAELIVAFLCREYQGKEWCGIEWSAIRDIIKKRQGDSVMFFRFDNAQIPGLFSKDGYIDATNKTPEQAAELIHKRLLHNRSQVPGTAATVCETPPASIDPAAVLQAANDILAFLRQERQFEQKLITLKPPPQTESDYPFSSDCPGSVMGSEQDEISVQIPLQFTDDFWENCKLTARAAEEWRIPRRGCINRLLRLRRANDQDTSLEDVPELLDQVEKLSEFVADNAFARSKL